MSDPTQLRDRAIDALAALWGPNDSPADGVDAVFAEVAAEVEELRSAYPEDVFPPLGDEWPEAPTGDRIGAHMARHVCDLLLSVLRPSEGSEE